MHACPLRCCLFSCLWYVAPCIERHVGVEHCYGTLRRIAARYGAFRHVGAEHVTVQLQVRIMGKRTDIFGHDSVLRLVGAGLCPFGCYV